MTELSRTEEQRPLRCVTPQHPGLFCKITIVRHYSNTNKPMDDGFNPLLLHKDVKQYLNCTQSLIFMPQVLSYFQFSLSKTSLRHEADSDQQCILTD